MSLHTAAIDLAAILLNVPCTVASAVPCWELFGKLKKAGHTDADLEGALFFLRSEELVCTYDRIERLPEFQSVLETIPDDVFGSPIVPKTPPSEGVPTRMVWPTLELPNWWKEQHRPQPENRDIMSVRRLDELCRQLEWTIAVAQSRSAERRSDLMKGGGILGPGFHLVSDLAFDLDEVKSWPGERLYREAGLWRDKVRAATAGAPPDPPATMADFAAFVTYLRLLESWVAERIAELAKPTTPRAAPLRDDICELSGEANRLQRMAPLDPADFAPSAPMTVRDLLRTAGLPIDDKMVGRMKKRLERLRSKDESCYSDVNSREARQAKFLYHSGHPSIRAILSDLKTSLGRP